ncbi:MAG: FAD-dependent oxidoreductase, partial [Pseudomonadota bacterium]
MKRKILFVSFIALLVSVFFVFDLSQYLDLAYLKAQQATFNAEVSEQPVKSALIYMAVYIAVAAVSLPGVSILTLAGGALFGFWWGSLLASFASTIGASFGFLVARFLVRAPLERRFERSLKLINRGLKQDGPLYLLTVRLVPIFPYNIVNLLMGISTLPLRTFYFFSQLGMLPATMVFVNAGTQLAGVDELSQVMSPGILGSLALLGIFPLVAKFGADWLRVRKFRNAFPPPSHVDRNLIVIGGGSAGLVAAYVAAAAKAKVTLIESNQMGGDCLNTGCVPSKALINAAKQIHRYQYHREIIGLDEVDAKVDFARVMDRVHHAINTIAPHDSIARYESLGVECIKGQARLVSPYSVEVDGKELSARAIIVATGAKPAVPAIPGLDDIQYLTSENLWLLRELPQRMVVLGGGPIGCELAQAFARLGAQVTQVEMAPRLLPREDDEVSQFVAHTFSNEGITVLTGHRAVAFVKEDGTKTLVCQAGDDEETSIPFDAVLIAVGRSARVQGFGLEELGVDLRDVGTIDVDDFLRTNLPTVFAAGDVAGPYQFTHAAAHQSWYASVNALLAGFYKFAVDYRVMPWCTFCDPEVARVGITPSHGLWDAFPPACWWIPETLWTRTGELGHCTAT